jgi:tetratricopeptide (TPR) repeat protein
MEGSVYSENRYCSYNFAISTAKNQLDKVEDINEIMSKAQKFIDNNSLQLAEIMLSKAIEKDSTNLKAHELYGFVSFMLGNYQDAKKANETILDKEPDNAYANKGMGLSLGKLGEVNRGIEYLRKAINLSDENFTDPYYDLAVLLMENDRREEALEVIEEGRKKYPAFELKSKYLYEILTNAS